MVVEDGRIILEHRSLIPEGEEWFWTEEWQAGEREVEEDIKAGRLSAYPWDRTDTRFSVK